MKAGDAKLPGAGMSPKQRARKCVAEKGGWTIKGGRGCACGTRCEVEESLDGAGSARNVLTKTIRMSDDAPTLVWPPLLVLSSDAVKVVYLDLNHWISLAQASQRDVIGVLIIPSSTKLTSIVAEPRVAAVL